MSWVDGMLASVGLERRRSAPDRPGPRARDRIIPRRNVRQLAAMMEREYNAAQNNRLTANWTQTPLPIDEIIRRNLKTLRARSRQQAANSDYAKRFLGLLKQHVIGPRGIQLRAQIVDLDGQPDSLATIAIERGWREWGKKSNCDAEGRLSWLQLQRVAISTVAEDGEVFIRKWRGSGFGPYGFQLQVLDAELVPVDYDRSLPGGAFIRHGIEFSRRGRPVAYWVADTDNPLYRQTAHFSYFASTLGNMVRVPADDMIHIFLPEKVGQKRGLPWLSTSLTRLNMLAGYEDAAMVAARVGASKMGFIAKEDAGSSYTADDLEDPDNPEESAQIEEVEPGLIRELEAGMKFFGYDPTYPHQQFPDFVKSILRGASCGMGEGVSYNDIANDLEGVNFSSLRHGRLNDQDGYVGLQEWLTGELHEDVYPAWLRSSLLSDALYIGNSAEEPLGILSIIREEKYRRVVWQGRRWKWVDPSKEVAAAREEIELGVRSRSSYIRERGEDPDEVWDEIARERATMEDVIGPGASAVGSASRISEDDEGDIDD